MVKISTEQISNQNPYMSTDDGLRKEFRTQFNLYEAAPKKDITFDQFCERVQVHGLLDWHKAKSLCAKAFWLFLIFLFLGVLIYGVYKSVKEYYTNPINTTVSMATNRSLRFPEILLCPQDYVNYRKQDQSFGDLKAYLKPRYTADLMDEGSIWEKLLTLEPVRSLPTYPQRRRIINVKTFKDYLSRSSFSPEQFLPQCKFGGREFNCSDYMQPFLHKDHELCYKISTEKMQNFPGIGLKILVDIHYDVFAFKDPPAFQGMYMSIADKIDPISMTRDVVGPGSFVKVNLDLQYEELISVPESNTPQVCQDAEFTEFEVLRGQYSFGLCKADCIYRHVFGQCGCIPMIDSEFVREKYHEEKYCNQTQVTHCVANIFDHKSDEIQMCSSGCQQPCKNWKIKVRQSQMKLGSPGSIKHFEEVQRHRQGQSISSPDAASSSYYEEPFNDSDSSTDSARRQKRQEVFDNTEAAGFTQSPSDPALSENNDHFNNTSGAAPNTSTPELVLVLTPNPPVPYEKLKDPNYWRNSLILLDIAFDDLMYTSVIQSRAKTVAELLSDIGGQTGLWLGCSIFSLIQLVVLVAGFFYTSSNRDQ